MIRRPPRSTLSSSSAASDVYKRQPLRQLRRPYSSPYQWTRVINGQYGGWTPPPNPRRVTGDGPFESEKVIRKWRGIRREIQRQKYEARCERHRLAMESWSEPEVVAARRSEVRDFLLVLEPWG
eukprot:TRINITY_DN8193_c0_g1_i4.p1 TRINITY_DN8193_c0_g1~~TRINITY_DN8193_c0_g1_i4.p1  ORF type:complete len:124 (-),score=13.51 TRINITY_DN8193_c0_g1_i4:334-705(-)